MKKQDVYDFLRNKNIDFEITEHEAMFSMSQLTEVKLPHPEADAKNLFVRDDKKRNYYLITVRGDKRVDLKAFRREQGTRPLSFAYPEELLTYMKLTPGSVSPFGLLENGSCNVKFFYDLDFEKDDGLIACHPNDNTATVTLKIADLMGIIKEHGNEVMGTEIPQK